LTHPRKSQQRKKNAHGSNVTQLEPRMRQNPGGGGDPNLEGETKSPEKEKVREGKALRGSARTAPQEVAGGRFTTPKRKIGCGGAPPR